MKILLGCPIRDRAWILPHYFQCIRDLNFDKKDITLIFLVNDSTDKTMDFLEVYKSLYACEFADFIILEENYGQIKDARITEVRQEIYKTLPILRNTLLDFFLGGNYDYFFSVDSDILFAPDTLSKLIAADKDIIAGQIWNMEGGTHPNLMKYVGKKLSRYDDFPRDRIFECDLTGAIYLISRRVIEVANVRYGYSPVGEDAYFCSLAKYRGYSIWCDPTVECTHIMNEGMLREYVGSNKDI